jgi:hypothetical protein
VAQQVSSNKSGWDLPPLVEVNPNAQVEKVVTVNKKDPLLVDLKVTNPIVYIKAWWKKVMANEGVDFRFRIRPLTAIAIALTLAGFSFGAGWIGSLLARTPLVQYIPELSPTPMATPNPWRDTAYTGILKYTDMNKTYYLLTQESEAITLQVPTNVAINKLVGKRILAVGRMNSQTGIFVVADASDLEILPIQITTVPTQAP